LSLQLGLDKSVRNDTCVAYLNLRKRVDQMASSLFNEEVQDRPALGTNQCQETTACRNLVHLLERLQDV